MESTYMVTPTSTGGPENDTTYNTWQVLNTYSFFEFIEFRRSATYST